MFISDPMFFIYFLLLGGAAVSNASNSEQHCWEDAATNFVQKKAFATGSAMMTNHKESLHGVRVKTCDISKAGTGSIIKMRLNGAGDWLVLNK
jgi:hypothetical protein